jgi:hypothetical protein
MDTILDNTLGENYFDTHALADFVSVCLHRCQQGAKIESALVMVTVSAINIVGRCKRNHRKKIEPTK